MASSRLRPPPTLLRKYFDGLVIDSPTSALAAKCMTASGLAAASGRADGRGIVEVALDESGAGIDGEAVALGEVVEDRDGVAAVEELLDADAADVARAPGDENVHV